MNNNNPWCDLVLPRKVLPTPSSNSFYLTRTGVQWETLLGRYPPRARTGQRTRRSPRTRKLTVTSVSFAKSPAKGLRPLGPSCSRRSGLYERMIGDQIQYEGLHITREETEYAIHGPGIMIEWPGFITMFHTGQATRGIAKVTGEETLAGIKLCCSNFITLL